MLKKVEVRKVMRMKRKGLRVIRKGAVLEGELPKALQRQGPKWAKRWPKVRLARVKPLACPHCGAVVRIASSGSEGGGATIAISAMPAMSL